MAGFRDSQKTIYLQPVKLPPSNCSRVSMMQRSVSRAVARYSVALSKYSQRCGGNTFALRGTPPATATAIPTAAMRLFSQSAAAPNNPSPENEKEKKASTSASAAGEASIPTVSVTAAAGLANKDTGILVYEGPLGRKLQRIRRISISSTIFTVFGLVITPFIS